MKAKVNKIGTHRHEGFAKIQVDIYPEPHHLCFFQFYQQVPDSSPRRYTLSPMFSYHVKVNPNMSVRFVKNMLRFIFSEPIVDQLDSLLSKPEAISNLAKISSIVDARVVFVEPLSGFMDNRIGEVLVNSKFGSIEVEVGVTK